MEQAGLCQVPDHEALPPFNCALFTEKVFRQDPSKLRRLVDQKQSLRLIDASHERPSDFAGEVRSGQSNPVICEVVSQRFTEVLLLAILPSRL